MLKPFDIPIIASLAPMPIEWRWALRQDRVDVARPNVAVIQFRRCLMVKVQPQ